MVGNWLKGAKLRRIDIDLYVYVKWVIWRDSQLDRLTNWIKLRRNA